MEALVWRRRRESSPAARKGRAAARGLDARRCFQNASCQRWTLHLRCQAYQNHLDIDHGIYRGVPKREGAGSPIACACATGWSSTFCVRSACRPRRRRPTPRALSTASRRRRSRRSPNSSTCDAERSALRGSGHGQRSKRNQAAMSVSASTMPSTTSSTSALSSPSPMTRITGSVPDGRITRRP
jgi:hypothetical protein